jgi:hypothetical protein
MKCVVSSSTDNRERVNFYIEVFFVVPVLGEIGRV